MTTAVACSAEKYEVLFMAKRSGIHFKSAKPKAPKVAPTTPVSAPAKAVEKKERKMERELDIVG